MTAADKDRTSALLTDLYQLTMLAGYFAHDMRETATFEFFARRLPDKRGFFVAAGLEQALDYLTEIRFSADETQWLASTGRFSAAFVDYLAGLRFTGDVHALPEGTVFFAGEPVLRVTAPIDQAQLVESRLINLLQFQTLVASKAARCVLAAPGKQLVDFGMRRSHGAEAALLAARAAYLAGFDGTATVLAQKRFGIPIFGTMAHSFIQAHVDEVQAYAHFAAAQPDNVVLLIDTYDTEAAARKVVALAPELKAKGITIKGVRLDSGDLAEHARRVRQILDDGGLTEATIFSSDRLDEHSLVELIDRGAPINGFGIGSRLVTSADAPYLDCAYKLVEYAGQPRRKRSEGKETWPGRKQIFRRYVDKTMQGDVISLEDDAQPGEPLLEPVMSGGRRVKEQEPLAAIRRRAADQLTRLPEHLRRLETAPPYPVSIAPALEALAAVADREAQQ